MSRTGHIAVALNHLARNAPATLAWGVAVVFILVVTTLFIWAGCFRLWQRLTGISTLSRGRLPARTSVRASRPADAAFIGDHRRAA
jgi:hypothetical protein